MNVRKYLTGDIEIPKSEPLAYRKSFAALLLKLAACARDMGEVWHVNSGYRSYAEQAALYDKYQHHGGARAAKPGTSNHNYGKACDVSDKAGRPVGATQRVRERLHHYGLCLPVRGEQWHVEIGSTWRN